MVQGNEGSGCPQAKGTDGHEGTTEETATRTRADERQVPTDRRAATTT